VNLLKDSRVKNRELQAEIERLQKQLDETPSSLNSWSEGRDKRYKAACETNLQWGILYKTVKEEIKELKKEVELLQSQKQHYYGKGWANGWGACEASGFHGQKSPDTTKLEVQILRREAKALKGWIERHRKRRPKELRQMTANDTTISKLIEENEKLKKIITKGHPALEELLTILRG
jgi:hypothetical protein